MLRRAVGDEKSVSLLLLWARYRLRTCRLEGRCRCFAFELKSRSFRESVRWRRCAPLPRNRLMAIAVVVDCPKLSG